MYSVSEQQQQQKFKTPHANDEPMMSFFLCEEEMDQSDWKLTGRL